MKKEMIKSACEGAGHRVLDHFADAGKTICRALDHFPDVGKMVPKALKLPVTDHFVTANKMVSLYLLKNKRTADV